MAIRQASAPRRSLLVLLAAAAAIFTGPAASRAFAATATTTTLTVTSGGSAVTTVASGSKVTLTATVTGNGAALTTGLVNFCDATATYCTDIHILGSAQLTSAGTAVLNLRPSIGIHGYRAVFAGYSAYTTSSSSSSTLTVTPSGQTPSTTSLGASGSNGNYVLTATVAGVGSVAATPGGTVSFIDTTNGNTVIGTSVLGSGTSTLANGSSLNGGSAPGLTITADFNGDGWPDIAALSQPTGGPKTVTVLLNNGNGTFTQSASLAAPPSNQVTDAITVADFNGDGKPDLVACGGACSIFLGNGDGTFTASAAPPLLTDYYGSAYTLAAATGDFNNDGKADLVVGGSILQLFSGNGDGTFTAPRKLGDSGFTGEGGRVTIGNFYNTVVGDFNGDGFPDIATSGGYYTADLLLLGQSDGSFITYGTPFSGSSTLQMAAVDVNGDGAADIVIPSCTGMQVFYGGSTPFGTSSQFVVDSARQYASCNGGSLVSAGDFNQDGTTDLLWIESAATQNNVSSPAKLNIAYGPFNTPRAPGYTLSLSASLNPNSLSVADINGDGFPDAVLSDGVSTLPVYLTASSETASASLSNFILSAGTHQIQAKYPGDATFGSSVSGTYPLSQVNTLTLSANPSGSAYGQQVALAATLTPYVVQGHSTDGELITFSSNGAAIGTAALTTGIATLNTTSLAGGLDLITSSYGGDTNLPKATSNTVSYRVKLVPVVTWNPPYTTAVYGSNFGPSLQNATSNVGSYTSITYVATPQGGGAPIPIAGYFTILPVGTYTITATAPPPDPDTYTSGSTSITYTVTPLTLQVVPSTLTKSYGTTNPSLGGSVTGARPVDTFTITGATTAVTTSPVGIYPITYTVTGSNLANYTVLSATGTLTITQAKTVLSWPAPNPINYGTALSANQLNATSNAPGTFAYSDTVGTVFAAGNHSLQAIFTPNDTTNYSAPTAYTLNVNLAVYAARLSLSAVNTARVYGAPNPTFAGNVTGAVNGDTFTESFSTTASAASPVGSYPIVPSVTGPALSNYTVAPANGILTISQAGTAATFTLSNNNSTLTANVVSLTSQVPTGSVGFYENQMLVGTGSLVNGTATYTTSSAPSANTVISAQYSGDVNFTQSASQPILLLTMQPALPSVTVSSAGSVSDAITLSAIPGFTSALTLSCSGLPQGATCTFSPASVTFSGTATSASSTMTIHTGGTASNVQPLLPGSVERSFTLAAMFWIPGLFATAFLRRKGKKRLPLRPLFVLLLFSGIAVSLTACGGSPVSGSKSVTGTSSVNVVATGSNGFTQTAAVSLTIQ